jgi:rSAM/selenodomain-associated transferase 1
VQVFAKAPVPGQVKTRLIPALGLEGATELYCRLVHRTLATAALARVGPTEIWATGPSDSAFLEACRRVLGLQVHLQPQGDLGARMCAAAAHALRRFAAVIIVGVDCPSMSFDDLHAAGAALAEGEDAVLGPAEDGGYALLGLRRVRGELFDGVAWGGSRVLQQTRRRLARLGWRWQELRTLWDVDRPQDVARLRRAGLLRARGRPTS